MLVKRRVDHGGRSEVVLPRYGMGLFDCLTNMHWFNGHMAARRIR